MPHILDPKRLSTDEEYCVARDELDDLTSADPDTPGGQRFDELAALIDEYEAQRRLERLRVHSDANPASQSNPRSASLLDTRLGQPPPA